MAKRPLSPAASDSYARVAKRPNSSKSFNPIKIATAEAAAAVDANTPFSQLTKLLKDSVRHSLDGKSVVYWMRMNDLRLLDNKALSRASVQARKVGVPLIVLFVISPQDYIAHDRSARRVDFLLRNLAILKESFSELHIPFHVVVHTPRKTIPQFIVSFCEEHGSKALYANMEYEVDELRRDIQTSQLAFPKDIRVEFLHDKCIIEPGVIITKQEKAYTVYSPYQKNWIATVNANLPFYLEDCSSPVANEPSVRALKSLGPLFESQIPKFIVGFELTEQDRDKMKEVWPAGEISAANVLERFLTTKKRSSQLGGVDPLASGPVACPKHNRIAKYGNERDRIDSDTTSRLSAYLTSGIISARQCARAIMLLTNAKKVESDKTSGIGRWLQEIAWRDFYVNILVFFPRVSMGRPFIEKFSKIVWEDHQVPSDFAIGQGGNISGDSENLQRWKTGMTGVPIVDASMRCLNEMGWMHNRARMITAMYLTKDLMIDWRVGERYFMEMLIDGDLSSNNGGWQWSASTGVDPCPYFRIFNPYTQSAKVDQTGDFIRHWIPELRKVRGPELHNPSASLASKLGYPLPIIAHNEARQRALRRYKNPGEE
ncbi:Deoxyribodipyrimidine photo-lyase [Psilocybe cubensis]|nr:Deoxyribodipyrimidine photo-lyase [Psilocybe cubensis]KAH9482561.1 Deoxyribodipyrimidine photo-lyase [Psilocybe cubensis]